MLTTILMPTNTLAPTTTKVPNTILVLTTTLVPIWYSRPLRYVVNQLKHTNVNYKLNWGEKQKKAFMRNIGTTVEEEKTFLGVGHQPKITFKILFEEQFKKCCY